MLWRKQDYAPHEVSGNSLNRITPHGGVSLTAPITLDKGVSSCLILIKIFA